MTFAPELAGARELAAWCAERGIIAAIGHSDADAASIGAAVEAGVSLSTHLGNGCALQLPRHPNLIWDQLAEDRLAATMIADGQHLPDAFMRVATRMKGERLLLISDATALAGAKPGTYEAPIGGRVVLEANGRLHVAGSNDTLAGAARSLLDGVLTLSDRGITGFEEAWEMASSRPAKALGLPGAPGDVLFDPATRLIVETRLGGAGSWKA
jgi:N-acetylglucosamine-6-phosphate deacetylase